GTIPPRALGSVDRRGSGCAGARWIAPHRLGDQHAARGQPSRPAGRPLATAGGAVDRPKPPTRTGLQHKAATRSSEFPGHHRPRFATNGGGFMTLLYEVFQGWIFAYL